MVQIIDRPESFSSKLGRSLGTTLSEAASQYASEARQKKLSQIAQKQKNAAKIESMAPSFVKRLAPSYEGDIEKYDQLLSRASQYTEHGLSPHEALSAAYQSLKGERTPEKKRGFASKLFGAPEEDKRNELMKILYGDNTRKQQREMEASGKKGKLKEQILDPYKKEAQPLEALKGLGVGALSGAERLTKDYGLRQALREFDPEQAKRLGIGTPKSQELAESLLEGKSPEEQELIKRRMATGEGVIPLSPEMIMGSVAMKGIGKGLKAIGGTKAFKSFWKGIKKLGKAEGKTTNEAATDFFRAAEQEGVDLGKAAAGDAEEAAKIQSLLNRVTKEAPKAPTQTHINRLSPESRMFKSGEQRKILEAQLKSHPKYAAEIAADAEKRAARLNKPKSDRARLTEAGNKALAEKALPEAREGYMNAAGRVRALEREMHGLGKVEQAKLEPLLDAAKQELYDSQTYYKAVASNTRHGSTKVAAPEMRKAAHNKMESIKDRIADNEPIELKKADYNPERVRRAAAIEKRKPVPGTKQDDFLTDVHDTYRKEYEGRLDQIKNEAKALPKTGAGAMQKLRLDKEAKVLEKLIKHTKADSTIHRHDLKLREMHQRKLAKERLGKFKEVSGSEKARELGKDFIKGKKDSATTAKKAADQAEKKFPGEKESIKKEKSEFSKGLEQVKEAGKEGAKKAKEGKSNPFKKLRSDIDEMLSKVPLLGKTEVGKQILIGATVASIDEIFQAAGIKVPYLTTLATAVGGRGAALTIVRTGTKITINKIVDAAKKSYQENQVEEAYREGDTKRIFDLKKKYSPKVFKKGKEKAFNR